MRGFGENITYLSFDIAFHTKLTKLLNGDFRNQTLCWNTAVYQNVLRPGIIDTISTFSIVSLASSKLDQGV